MMMTELEDGCTVYPTLQEWSLPPAEYVSRLFHQHRSYGLVRIVPPTAAPTPLDLVHTRLAAYKGHHCNRQKVRREADGAAFAITAESFQYANPLTIDELAVAFAIEERSQGSEGPQMRRFGSARELLDAAQGDSLWKEEGDGSDLNQGRWTYGAVAKAEDAVWAQLDLQIGAVYSSENEFSGYPAPSEGDLWNIRDLGDTLSALRTKHREVMPGINTPFTYIGASGSAFAYHKEDFDLASLNVHVLGAPKIWYSVHEEDVTAFERHAAEILPAEAASCEHFLRHKRYLFHPKQLARPGIRMYRTVQMPGDYIITFPQGYHGGVNLGYNINEAINIAPDFWHDFAVRATTCDLADHVVNAGSAALGYKVFRKHLGLTRIGPAPMFSRIPEPAGPSQDPDCVVPNR